MKLDAGIDKYCLQSGAKESDTAVILLHGYGASQSDLYPIGRVMGALSTEASWYFPNGIIELPWGGRAWFDIDVARLEAARAVDPLAMAFEEPDDLPMAIQHLAQLMEWIKSRHKKVILGGFSQGAMLATAFAMRHPRTVAGLVLLSGAPLEANTWSRLQSQSAGQSFFQSHGKSDPVLAFKAARHLYDQLTAAQWVGEFHEFSGQHEIPNLVLQELSRYLTDIDKRDQ